MVVRSETVGLSGGLQLDVPAQDMGKRTRLQKVENPQGAFVVSCGIFNQQSARQQKIPRKKNPGSAVVKRHLGLAVSRRGNYVHSAAALIHYPDQNVVAMEIDSCKYFLRHWLVSFRLVVVVLETTRFYRKETFLHQRP